MMKSRYILQQDLIEPAIITVYEDSKAMPKVGTLKTILSGCEARTPQNDTKILPDQESALQWLISLHRGNIKPDLNPAQQRAKLESQALTTYTHALHTRAKFTTGIKREFLKRIKQASNEEIQDLIDRLNKAIEHNENIQSSKSLQNFR